MKKLMLILVLIIGLSSTAFANENATDDNSINDAYKIELGNGEGSLIITGDNNTIYLPPGAKEKVMQPNEVTENEGTYTLVLNETDVIIDGVITRFNKLVLLLNNKGWKIVWAEQE